MSTTSISRNNNQKNKIALSNIKNKILSNDITNLGIKNNNKLLDNIIKDMNSIKQKDKINKNIVDGANKTLHKISEKNNNNYLK